MLAPPSPLILSPNQQDIQGAETVSVQHRNRDKFRAKPASGSVGTNLAQALAVAPGSAINSPLLSAQSATGPLPGLMPCRELRGRPEPFPPSFDISGRPSASSSFPECHAGPCSFGFLSHVIF